MCVCVLGKQGFVGCDCLIPGGGSSFHSLSHVIPQHGAVRRVSSISGFRLVPAITLHPPWIAGAESSCGAGGVTVSAKVGRPMRGLEQTQSCPIWVH